MKIALITLGGLDFEWPHGPSHSLEMDFSTHGHPAQAGDRPAAGVLIRAIDDAVEQVLVQRPDLVLTWDTSLGTPDGDLIRSFADSPGDVWHGGLKLGQRARPELLETVHPTWMLAYDPPVDRLSSSWRLSLRACLFRPDVWRRIGGPDDGYSSLTGSSLELGHRWLWGGAVLRHAPNLVGGDAAPPQGLPVEDEMRFLFQRAGRFWATWALGRGLLSRRLKLSDIGSWWRQRGVKRSASEPSVPATDSDPCGHEHHEKGPVLGEQILDRVTVLIPTLDRYPYLRVVLEQLGRQSVKPAEVIVIDQTEPARRERYGLDRSEFPDLPLVLIERDQPGQSSARNAGLRRATGDVILFIDDDVEMAEDLIARHLDILRKTGADASCGVTEEIGAGPLPAEFRRPRISDVFPTCNAALRRRALESSGLFDLAFDHGSRADADLGTRLYLSGAFLRLSPSISVLHHKAPAGGLRQHKARVQTYAASRRSLVRHLPSITEIYLSRRYGSEASTREMLWQRTLGTLRARGSRRQKITKLLWGLAVLPDTVIRIASRVRRARAFLRQYPQIPSLQAAGEEAEIGPAERATEQTATEERATEERATEQRP